LKCLFFFPLLGSVRFVFSRLYFRRLALSFGHKSNSIHTCGCSWKQSLRLLFDRSLHVTSERRCKMAPQERRTCTINIRNWHHILKTSLVIRHILYSQTNYPKIWFLLFFSLKGALLMIFQLYDDCFPMTPPYLRPPTAQAAGYCSVVQQGYGCMETCRGRPGTKIQRRIKKQEAGGGRGTIRSSQAQRGGLCSL